jgi:hypothetical protein
VPPGRRPVLHLAATAHRRRRQAAGLRDEGSRADTSAENLAPQCKRNHDSKTAGAWTIDRHDDGSYTWTSPTKHTYRYRPPELPVPEPDQPYGELADENDDPPPF